MAIDFTSIEQTIEQTKAEVAEYDASTLALADGKQVLTEAQAAVATAQDGVNTLAEAAASEKADVVAGVTAAISQLQAVLADLQA